MVKVQNIIVKVFMRVITLKVKNTVKESFSGKMVLIFKVHFRKETSMVKEYTKVHLLSILTKESILKV